MNGGAAPVRAGTRPRSVRIASGVLRWAGAAAAIAALFVLWPARFGGATTVVTVSGTSMQPTYHTGDVLIARRRSHYSVGDVVVYRVPVGQPGAGQLVVHRVISTPSDGTLVLKGDNRALPDDIHPGAADLVGAVTVDLGGLVGRLLRLGPSIVVGLACAVIVYRVVAGTEEPDDLDGLDAARASGPVVGGNA